MKKVILLTLVCCLSFACTGTKNVRGSLIKDYEISRLREGVSTKQQVISILGTPSSQSTLNVDKWYYVTDYVATKPLKKTKVEKRLVLVLNFKDGVLNQISKLEKGAKNFSPEEVKTQTQGEKLGIFEQFVLNITSGLKSK